MKLQNGLSIILFSIKFSLDQPLFIYYNIHVQKSKLPFLVDFFCSKLFLSNEFTLLSNVFGSPFTEQILSSKYLSKTFLSLLQVEKSGKLRQNSQYHKKSPIF